MVVGMVLNPIIPIELLVLAGAGCLLASGLAAWRSSVKCAPVRRATITAARLLGIAFLLLIAFNPGRWNPRTEQAAGEWALLLDQSASMAAADADGGPQTRWAKAKALAELALKDDTRAASAALYTFADRVTPASLSSLAQQPPDGPASDVAGACRDLLTRYRTMGRTLTGILLISDGRQLPSTDPTGVAALARARETPIHALSIGGNIARRDIAIRFTRTRTVAFTAQETRLTVEISGVGLDPLRCEVDLRDNHGQKVASQTVELTDGATATAVFAFTPTTKGYAQYSAEIAAWPGEKNIQNNTALTALLVLDQRIRILTVEGVPHWDSKFLLQRLHLQPNVEVTSLYRLAADRFFSVTPGLQQADQTDNVQFPDDEASLQAYDLIIIGKGVEYFLTPRRIELLRHFLRDQGGGILFARGKPYARDFPELLALEPLTWGDPSGCTGVLHPAPAGLEAGLFGDMLPDAKDEVWQRLPPLRDIHRITDISPFTLVLAEAMLQSPGQTVASTTATPLILARRYGKGLVVTVNAGDFWKWDFFPDASEARAMYASLWAQLTQWIVTYSEFLPGEATSLKLTPDTVLPGEPVRAAIQRRFDAAQATDPLLRVTGPDGKTALEISAGRHPGDDARRDAIFTLNQPGNYLATVVDPSTGKELTHAVALCVAPPPEELDNPDADPAFLKRLTTLSGGSLITEDALVETIERLIPRHKSTTTEQAVWQPLWNTGWILGLTALFFSLEWFMRRRGGLL